MGFLGQVILSYDLFLFSMVAFEVGPVYTVVIPFFRSVIVSHLTVPPIELPQALSGVSPSSSSNPSS